MASRPEHLARGRLISLIVLMGLFSQAPLAAQIPHNQDRPPGPPRSPGEARDGMTVPEGFRVELVAHEPDIVNPVKMSFDDRGRIWITESLEYPRRSAGPGRDRIKILEDTDRDGMIDTVKVFADDLNIPCGIALGHGGVFVTNAPDILFLEDTDGDDRADRRTVLFSGFGRHDTHELPNTLRWGPDGWLYGLNGVFNPARIDYRGRRYEFTCALWRFHPRTRDFEIFSEGTSNPWGVAWDRNGSAFVEACVIDHLYHLVETGYYHRQGGPYPPFTWKIDSIVDHAHQKAAYCGLDYYDADVYPELYRDRLYMGNIHGNCINVDRLERDGSTYLSRSAPDFLSANDVWSMPVAIRLGPDGCFYLLDWYDRYHCYQDARRDPEGIDRERGRLYRVAYGEAPLPPPFDLAQETSLALVERLRHANRWWRTRSRVVLAGRRDRAASRALIELTLDATASRKARLEALWTLASCENPGEPPTFMNEELFDRLLRHDDPTFRAWAVRIAGDLRLVPRGVRDMVLRLAADEHPDVRLQVAIAAKKLDPESAVSTLMNVLAHSADDPLIPRIVWRNLEPLLETGGASLAVWLEAQSRQRLHSVESIVGRIVERLLAREEGDPAPFVSILRLILENRRGLEELAGRCLDALFRAVVNGQLDVLDAPTSSGLRARIEPLADEALAAGRRAPLYVESVTLAATWRSPAALESTRRLFNDDNESAEVRERALRALLASSDGAVLDAVRRELREPEQTPPRLLRTILSSLGKLETPGVARVVIESLGRLPPELHPLGIDLLTQRPAWARILLDAVASGDIDRRALNVTQIRRIIALDDHRLTSEVERTWGKLRLDRDPDRERVIARMKALLAGERGNPWAGKTVFEKNCAQCHTIFGAGQDVGPDITVNGRETVDQLLSNMLDPNLVIGKDYYARTVLTRNGRVISGLLVEDAPAQLGLKVAGGAIEIVPRRDILRDVVGNVSLMPEGLEENMSDREFRDLVAFLRYEAAPPPPVETTFARNSPLKGPALGVEQDYGHVRIRERSGSSDAWQDVVGYRHSADGRPFLWRLRAPGGGPVLTGPREGADTGVFLSHRDVDGIDFSNGRGWIRSTGVTEVIDAGTHVTIHAGADWLTQRRGGERVLAERQSIRVQARGGANYYLVDIESTLLADRDVTFGESASGGLVVAPAEHDSGSLDVAVLGHRWPWVDLTARFGGGKTAGITVFDHSGNPGFPTRWGMTRNEALTSSVPEETGFRLRRGESRTLRYRLLVHDGLPDPTLVESVYRSWDKHAADTLARLRSATGSTSRGVGVPRAADHELYDERLRGWAPGFRLGTVGLDGIRILEEFRERRDVLQSHPWSEDTPAWFERSLEVPSTGASLLLETSHHPEGDWRLMVRADGLLLLDAIVGPQSTRNGWSRHEVDLSPFAGRRVRLQVLNHANNWKWEYAYWSRIEVVER